MCFLDAIVPSWFLPFSCGWRGLPLIVCYPGLSRPPPFAPKSFETVSYLSFILFIAHSPFWLSSDLPGMPHQCARGLYRVSVRWYGVCERVWVCKPKPRMHRHTHVCQKQIGKVSILFYRWLVLTIKKTGGPLSIQVKMHIVSWIIFNGIQQGAHFYNSICFLAETGSFFCFSFINFFPFRFGWCPPAWTTSSTASCIRKPNSI